MPSRRSGGGGGGTVRRKHSLGNVRRAHPASGAEWNVQVVRGKMTSKCLWHACRALVLGLTLMLLGAGMATLGYYADYLAMAPELRGNATVRVKNDLKGFHLSNFSYVGPIVMGFGGFIVVASCVMTFEARDSAAKVVPARFRAGGGSSSKTTVRSNQSSSASQRRAIGMQLQSSRWDQHFGVFRTSPAEPPQSLVATATTVPAPFDRDALTAELIKFSKTLSASARFSPQVRRLTYTGSVPNLSTIHASHQVHAHYSTNLSHLLSPRHKTLLLEHNKRNRPNNNRHHHHHHHHHHHRGNSGGNSGGGSAGPSRHLGKARGQRISNSLVQRTTRESCSLLQPPPPANRMLWHAASFDESGRAAERARAAAAERTRRSDTAKRHVLSRQKPIEQQEQEEQQMQDSRSPLGHRRCSTMSDSSYSGRWTVRCSSIASRTSSIDSRRIQVDLHSPEVMPKSILRSPKRYSTVVSTTPSVEKEFRSQLSVCSEPPATVRQLSGQSSLEPCFPEENSDGMDFNDKPPPVSPPGHTHSVEELSSMAKITSTTSSSTTTNPTTTPPSEQTIEGIDRETKTELQNPVKPQRPDSLPLKNGAVVYEFTKANAVVDELRLQRSSSSRTFYRPKAAPPKEFDDSIFYIRSMAERQTKDAHDFYDSLQVINERRTTLLKADSETTLLKVGAGAGRDSIADRKASNFSLMQEIPERGVENASFDRDADEVNAHDKDNDGNVAEKLVTPPKRDDITLQMEDLTVEEQQNAALP